MNQCFLEEGKHGLGLLLRDEGIDGKLALTSIIMSLAINIHYTEHGTEGETWITCTSGEAADANEYEKFMQLVSPAWRPSLSSAKSAPWNFGYFLLIRPRASSTACRGDAPCLLP